MKWKFHPGAAEEYLASCRYYAEFGGKLGEAFSQSERPPSTRLSRNPRPGAR